MSEQKKCRCAWLDATKPDYVLYHDLEWGVPVYDDQTLFEFITLESAQAGLSWYTILKKRQGYKNAFANFDVNKVALFTQDDVERLMLDENIVRNRLKINATINNAKQFIDIQKDTKAAGKYKIVVVPTIVIYKDGEEVARFQANIMMTMEATQKEVQGKIDEIIMEDF